MAVAQPFHPPLLLLDKNKNPGLFRLSRPDCRGYGSTSAPQGRFEMIRLSCCLIFYFNWQVSLNPFTTMEIRHPSRNFITRKNSVRTLFESENMGTSDHLILVRLMSAKYFITIKWQKHLLNEHVFFYKVHRFSRENRL